MTYAITLSSTGETMTGLDGSSLSGLDRDEAERLARELSQTWARELGDDKLEITEEQSGFDARGVAEELVADHRACWVSDASGRKHLGVTYGANADSVEEAEGELESLREEIGAEYARQGSRSAVTVGDSGPEGPGYYAVLLVAGKPVSRG